MPISRLSGHANIDDAAIDGFTGDYSPEIMGNYCVGSFMKAFNAFRVSRLLEPPPPPGQHGLILIQSTHLT